MLKKLMTILVSVSVCFSSYADVLRPVGDASWYYSIGGGDPMMYYHQSNKTTLNLSAGVEWRLFRRCSFDPAYSISDTFKNIKENLYGMANDVLDSAIVTFSAWGLSKIQENNPGMYDQIAKGLADAKESYQLSLKNCRDVQSDLRAQRNPADGWYSVSRKNAWAKASAEGANPVVAEKQIEEKGGENGLTWVDGARAGGRNLNGTLQPPIRAVGDVVEAGYEHVVGNKVIDLDHSDGIPAVTGDPNVARVFGTPEEAAAWTAAVVGEREIRTCPGCELLRTSMGQGLRYQYQEEKKVADKEVLAVLKSNTISSSELEALSVPSMGVTINDYVIRSLQDAPPHERTIMMNRLSGEIALARVMEKALIARDLLNAGVQEPNVAAVGDIAMNEIDISRARLQAEIENVLFETQVRNDVLTNAAGVISQRGTQRRNDSKALQMLQGEKKSRDMREGGVVN